MVLLLVLVAAACGTDRDAGGEPIEPFTWMLTAGTVDGSPLVLIDRHPITFRVEDGEAGGTAACNHYGGRIVIDGNSVSFPDGLFQTEMACLDSGVMELEAAFLAALLRVTGSAVGGSELRLTGNGVDLRFAHVESEPDAPLVGTTWNLETLLQGESASTVAAPATLHIGEDGKVTGSTGCNTMFGTYETGSGFSPLGTTKIGCEPAVMAQEQLVLAVLDADSVLTIEGSLLTITGSGSNALQYRADG